MRQESKDNDNRRTCRVIIENKFDYHHEVIESAVSQFPLPWEIMNCNSNNPIIYDFSLLQNRWSVGIGGGIGGIPTKKANHLNETEFWGWKTYFEEHLQGKTFKRKDGHLVYYNSLISYDQYEGADAIIGLTCNDSGPQNFVKWIKMGDDKSRYCILHGSGYRSTKLYSLHRQEVDNALNRSYFLVPSMWPSNQCTFLPTDLPKIEVFQKASEKNENDENEKDPSELKICVFGNNAGDSDAKLAAVFSQVPYHEYNAKFYIASRYPASSKEGKTVTKTYMSQTSIANRTLLVHSEVDFVKFAKFQASCDILLPKTVPSTRPAFFPSSVSGNESLHKIDGEYPRYRSV